MHTMIYAAYRGDDYLMDGTLEELSAAPHRKKINLQWLMAPTGKRRIDESYERAKKTGKKNTQLVVIRIDDDEEDG